MSYARDILSYAPSYMRGANMRILLGGIGEQLDANAETILGGRLQANPYAGGAKLADGRLIQCDAFVLPIHAEQRGLRLYSTEGELSQRIRLSQYLELHSQRGTHRGELNHVRPYFASLAAFPTMWIVHQTGSGISIWHKMDPDGVYSVIRPATPNFNFDGQTTKRSRWWAFLEMEGTGVEAPNTYGDGHTYGDGSIYGVGLSSRAQADVIAMFQDWKGAHSWLAGVILVWAGAIDPTAAPVQNASGWWSLPNGKWGNIVDPSTGLGTRPPGFQWIYDHPA